MQENKGTMEIHALDTCVNQDETKLEGFWVILEHYNMQPQADEDMTDKDWAILWKMFVSIRML